MLLSFNLSDEIVADGSATVLDQVAEAYSQVAAQDDPQAELADDEHVEKSAATHSEAGCHISWMIDDMEQQRPEEVAALETLRQLQHRVFRHRMSEQASKLIQCRLDRYFTAN